MKQIIIAFFAIGALAILAFAGLGLSSGKASDEKEFLRLHIRANSNSTADQDIKYLIRQEIVNELTPIFVDVTSKQQAMEKLDINLDRIKSIADNVLASNGFTYTARTAIKTEHFPTRAYNDVVLPDGVYDALIIELGAGTGDNWWSVVYPPLCFLENNIGGNQGVIYRSKLQELINKWFFV